MANPPTVLFINRVFPPGRGATGRVLRDLARGFARDGWSVTILTTGPDDRDEKDGSIRIIRVKSAMSGKTIFSYTAIWVKFLIRGLKAPAHDLVVTMTDPPMLVLAGCAIARVKKSRHIHWCQDLYPDLLPLIGLGLPDFMMTGLVKLSRAAMKKCDRVVAIGRCMARHLVSGGLDAKKIAVIPNWPDAELLNNRMTVNAAIKNGIRGDMAEKVVLSGSAHARPFEELFRDGDNPKFRVLYSGTLGRAHPLGTVLDAAEILARSHPMVELVFVGDGPGQERLAQERARRGLENIRLLPWQPASRLRELMESGDIHMISMNHDAAGLLVPSKIYSALAVGRPCVFIGPVQCEAARVIIDFKAGVVVPQGEPQVLARAILSYCESSDTWFAAHAGAGQAGRIFVPDEAIAAWIKRARDTLGLATVAER